MGSEVVRIVKLRRTGTCRRCGCELASERHAMYYRATGEVACFECALSEYPAANAVARASRSSEEPRQVAVALRPRPEAGLSL